MHKTVEVGWTGGEITNPCERSPMMKNIFDAFENDGGSVNRTKRFDHCVEGIKASLLEGWMWALKDM